jgi:8-oxo-dGTP pyrophosphatase MutT (NUDIX family)
MESGVVNAVGIWFYSITTDRYLYLLRNDERNPNTWGLPGGKCDAGEALMDTLKRECQEELGSWPEIIKLVPIEKFTSPDQRFCYHTFFCSVGKEFIPELNNGHNGYAWIDSNVWPKPLHPGLWSTINFDEIKQKISVIQEQYQTPISQ